MTPGTSHGDELGYLFKSIFTPNYINPCSPEAVLLWKMVKMWANFARTGNPNLVGEVSGVTWEPIDKDKINFLNIGSNLTVGVNPESERVVFWEGLPAAVSAEGKWDEERAFTSIYFNLGNVWLIKLLDMKVFFIFHPPLWIEFLV